jgi:hypothetical protein
MAQRWADSQDIESTVKRRRTNLTFITELVRSDTTLDLCARFLVESSSTRSDKLIINKQETIEIEAAMRMTYI